MFIVKTTAMYSRRHGLHFLTAASTMKDVFEQVSMHNIINFIKETHFYTQRIRSRLVEAPMQFHEFK